MKACGICERARPEENCVSFELTAEEEAAMAKQGLDAPREVTYCRRCWGLLKDPITGPRLMRGNLERQLLRIGVAPRQAKKLADQYHVRLVELQRQQHHGTKQHVH